MLTIITPSAEIASFPRMNKLLAALADQAVPCDHWYWNRGPGRDPVGRCLYRGGGYNSRRLALHYVAFMVRVLGAVLSNGAGRDFYCLGFAAALPVAVAARIGGHRYLYDNNDNLSLSHRWPAPVAMVIAAIERFIVRGARIHMVPSLSRWREGGSNLRVVANVPSSAVLHRAREIVTYQGLARRGTLTVYFNGLLTDERGIMPLLRMLDGWNQELPLRILVAGRLGSDTARTLVQHRLVEYLGVLQSVEALAHYAEAHVALTLYDPAVAINRLAEPNKWGDCVVMSTPFIVNEEVETARPFVERGACFTVPYHDTEALRGLLAGFVANRAPLERAAQSLAAFGWNPWECQILSVIDEFCGRPNM